jgi:hypothetical protein
MITNLIKKRINRSNSIFKRNNIGQVLQQIESRFYNPDQIHYVDKNVSGGAGDGTSWVNAYDTIQEGVDACGDGVGDLVIVAPGKYTENVAIINHASIKIIALFEGWETRIRPSDATDKLTLTPAGGSAIPGCGFAVMSRSVEISGFILDTGGGYCGIYVGDGYRIDTSYDENAASARIRNNYFRGGSEGLYGIVLDGCSDNVVIEDNIFDGHTAPHIYISPGGSRTVQNPIIRGNEFKNTASGIYGIDMYNSNTTVGIVVRENSFGDKTAVDGYACRFQGTGVHHFVGNYDCSNGGATGSATDYMAGNFEAHAMSSPVYVGES